MLKTPRYFHASLQTKEIEIFPRKPRKALEKLLFSQEPKPALRKVPREGKFLRWSLGFQDDPILSGLTNDQKLAVTASPDTMLDIISGPGASKTEIMARRAAFPF